MRIKIKGGVRCFRKSWINTLGNLGFLSGDPGVDSGVIGEITETPGYTILDCPDLPDEALEVLKGYFGETNVRYED